MTARLRRGEPVLPLGFGEAGLPVHTALRATLAASATCNSYGPVAGHPALRAAAAGYWDRRGLPTRLGSVICGPGSKALLFALMLAIGGDVAIPRPSWVSYTAHARLLGIRAHPLPVAAGEGGICDPAALDAAIHYAWAAGRPIRSTIVTLPDNPTGRLPAPGTVRALCQVAEAHGLVIICDEIYRDLIHDPATPVLSPAEVAPQRTAITTGLSKSLALGGWRIGVARMPDGPLGIRLRTALIGAASEIWSAPAAPVQHAAALAFCEPAEISERISFNWAMAVAIGGWVSGSGAASAVSCSSAVSP
jgi:aspartate aminotransferase